MKRRISWILGLLACSIILVACTSVNLTPENSVSENPKEGTVSAISAIEETVETEKADDSSEAVMEETREEMTTEEMTTEEMATEEMAEETAAIEEKVEEDTTAELLKEYTGPVQVYEASKTLYAASGLNVRRGPGTNYEIMGSLAYNQSVEATGVTGNGWVQCSFNGQTGYASGNYLSETKEEPKAEAANANTSQAASDANKAAPAADTAAPAAQAAPSAQGGIIMIGDSRCVQMQAAVNGGGVSWICENGKGYKWFNETAVGWADPSVGKGTKVVICLGVNDPGNVQNYAQLVNTKAAEWSARGATVYYVSVNPVWENPYVTQEQVDNFNNTMPGLLSGVIWIDTQSWLKENGCRIVDGLHYDDPTSVNIFNLIMGSI